MLLAPCVRYLPWWRESSYGNSSITIAAYS